MTYDMFAIIYKYFVNTMNPEIVYKTAVTKQNVGQRFIVIHEYYAYIATKFSAIPNYARYQMLSVDKDEAKSRQLAYLISEKFEEKYNIELDSNGVETVNGENKIASIRSISKPISQGIVSGGLWQYSQNYEVRF